MANSNVITVIPLFTHTGRGPSVVINLYHNAIAALSDLQTGAACGFAMSDGWSTSYSGQVVSVDSTTAHVIEDDGTTNIFTKISNAWTPPSGVHDTLAYNSTTGWLLKRKDSSYRKFDVTWGRLTTVGDASGNEITLSYDANEALERITDAAGRHVDFHVYLGKLEWIRDDVHPELPQHGYRVWTLGYAEDETFHTLTDPEYLVRSFAYTDGGRIGEFTDRNSKTWTMGGKTYGLTVTDPSPLDSQTQHFDFTEDVMAEVYASTYTDRRNTAWHFDFDDAAPPQRALKGVTDPLEYTAYYIFDADRNLTGYVDQLGSGPSDASHKWVYTYDSNGNGNCESATDPLGHTWSAEYDSQYPTNLLSMTPPVDDGGNPNTLKRVTFRFDDPNHPTSVTTATQPAADDNGDPAVTTIAYYAPDYSPSAPPLPQGSWNGFIASVVDANAVKHKYTYDKYGHPHSETESKSDDTLVGYRWWTSWDAASFPIEFDAGLPTDGGDDESELQCCWRVRGQTTHTDNGRTSSRRCRRRICRCSNPTLAAGECAPPGEIDTLNTGCGSISYDNEGRPTEINSCVQDNNTEEDGSRRWTNFSYNALGQLESYTMTTPEPVFGPGGSGSGVSRTFYNAIDMVNGVVTRTGPDSQATSVVLDVRGQVHSVERGGLTATYEYYPDGQIDTVTNGNGTRTRCQYDNARRLTAIIHERLCSSTWTVMLTRAYGYSPEGLITDVVEQENQTPCTTQAASEMTIAYTYDRRNRLIVENYTIQVGENTQSFGLTYTYDQVGNRLSKTSGIDTVTNYYYDVHPTYTCTSQPTPQETWGNRLVGYCRSVGGNPILEASYEYNEIGNPTRIVYHDLTPTEYRQGPEFKAIRFYYDSAERIWMTLADSWNLDEYGAAVDCQREPFREYRYDGGPERYLMRTRPSTQPSYLVPNDDAEWTEFSGGAPYNDLSIARDGGAVTKLRGYTPGIGQEEEGATSQPAYAHADQIGSTRLLTDANGAIVRRQIYSAFGERITTEGSQSTRYQYAGAWGYERMTFPASQPNGSPVEIPFIHVGARWYDPESGRFLQRDPIGLRGGLNMYAYACNLPTSVIDPTGFAMIWWPLGPPPSPPIRPMPGDWRLTLSDDPFLRYPPRFPPLPPKGGLVSCGNGPPGSPGKNGDVYIESGTGTRSAWSLGGCSCSGNGIGAAYSYTQWWQVQNGEWTKVGDELESTDD